MVDGLSRGLVATAQNENAHIMRCWFIHCTPDGSDKAQCRKCQISTATPAEPGASYEALGQEYLDIVRPKHDLMFRCQIVIRYQNVSHIKRGHRYHCVSTELCVVGDDDDFT
jgi:hypothetical protein